MPARIYPGPSQHAQNRVTKALCFAVFAFVAWGVVFGGWIDSPYFSWGGR
jgi:hypothetical protein